MDLSTLQTFLSREAIPEIKKRPKTFLGIAKQPHYENVLSNIYAFFFDVYEDHGFHDLFIKSLIECIGDSERKDKDFSYFNDFEVETEYSTKGIGKTKRKGRIDLLLSNGEKAIIIENKVYHHLNNDLDDYWESINVDAKSKIGIILSLKPISQDQYSDFVNQNEFINITHSQLMAKVMYNGKPYLDVTSESHKNYHFYLRDLYQNILNISTPTMDKNEIGFFTDNKTRINQLVSLKYQFKQHVISGVEHAGSAMMQVQPEVPRHKSNARRLRYYRSKLHPDLVYTIVFGGLFDEDGHLHIIVEPRGKTLRNGAVFKNLNLDEKEKEILQPDFYSKTNEAWAHFASRRYAPTTEEIADLTSFIQNKISEDSFASIFSKMEALLFKVNNGS